MMPLEIDVQAVDQMLKANADMVLIDCREPDEYETARIEGAHLIPMGETGDRLDELQRLQREKLVVYCHHGRRSLNVVNFLRQNGFDNAQSMSGGIDAWSLEIDPEVPRY